MAIKYIDMTPTWESLIPMLVELAANGTTMEARQVGMDELMKLARFADQQIAKMKGTK